jgi:hypothetical protein
MKVACPRRWQVEAARDGRLSRGDIARFEMHRAHCLSCQEEALHMETVAELVRGADRQLDDLSLRRLRQRLLASADAAMKRPAAAALGRSAPPQEVPSTGRAGAAPPAQRRRAKGSVAALAHPEATAESGMAQEDIAYLHILALLGEGRTEEAVLAAHSYLARFPDGFRGPEVRTIALGR